MVISNNHCVNMFDIYNEKLIFGQLNFKASMACMVQTQNLPPPKPPQKKKVGFLEPLFHILNHLTAKCKSIGEKLHSEGLV